MDTNKLKRALQDPYYAAELIYRRCLSSFVRNDETYLKVSYFLCCHKKLNLNNPELFTEKMQWLKLHNRREEFTRMVDKYEAKEYVRDIIGEEYIIPTIGVWDNFSDIDFNELPNQFVLKCTHDSGGLVICKDKESFDKDKARRKICTAMSRNYYMMTREWPYKNVRRRVIAEQYMQNGTDAELTDYKFFCFNGKAKYCQVIANRHTDETIDFYDREWTHQPFIGLQPTAHLAPILHPVPENYDTLLFLVDKLAAQIASPFVRIDFYVINSRPYFGEITFFPAGGHGVFRPEEWNRKLGEMIDLSRVK